MQPKRLTAEQLRESIEKVSDDSASNTDDLIPSKEETEDEEQKDAENYNGEEIEKLVVHTLETPLINKASSFFTYPKVKTRSKAKIYLQFQLLQKLVRLKLMVELALTLLNLIQIRIKF
jgi:hypothetical protein